MRYLGALLLGMVLGAVGGILVYREVVELRSPATASSNCADACPASMSETTPGKPERIQAPSAVAEGLGSRDVQSELPAVAAAGPIPTGLLIPVEGIAAAQLADTFTDARSEGRSHDAIDIMAAAGTPVLAVADGHIEKLFDSVRGGLTVYQFEPTGAYAYYYAHLQRYADGLAEKQSVRRGQVIGYVGSTGNADPAAPHLHFAIFLLGPERRWSEGVAINPYPSLVAGERAVSSAD